MIASMVCKRILIAGHFGAGSLEHSYRAAFESLDCQVSNFDLLTSLRRYTRLGTLGRFFNMFVPVEPWVRKMGRDLVLAAMEYQPDIILTVGHYPFRSGPLAQMRIACQAKFVHIWPDTLVNWMSDLTACLPLYDLVATYSRSSVEVLKRLGARNVAWVPLAGDSVLHPRQSLDVSRMKEIDVAFVGGWRPEREAILTQLTHFDLRIWGPDWGRRSGNNPAIQHAWQGKVAVGREFAEVVHCSKVNLNIIDPTNYPAANMRFFEIPMAGGLQVCSRCPEMEDEFRHGEHIFYYHCEEELPDLIRALLNDEPQRQKVAAAAHNQVMTRHLYKHRAQMILDELSRTV